MVTLQNVTLSFRDGKTVKTVLNDLSLTFPEGKTIVVMGPSGCGKTTLLRVIAGLESPDTGNVTRETESISYLFQDTALLPWLTAQENVNLVLSDKKDTLTEALEWLARVDLEGEANTYPASLSGGMRQRVALARAPPFGTKERGTLTFSQKAPSPTYSLFLQLSPFPFRHSSQTPHSP